MGKIYIGQNLLADTKETMLSAASDVGAVFMWGSDTPPKGCLLCDGAAYSRTEYSQLFNVIGTTYGAGDGSATFNLPDMRGRVAVGRDAAQTEFDALNESGGEKTHTLTVDEMPPHYHHTAGSLIFGSDGTFEYSLSLSTDGATGPRYTSSVGGGQEHNNLQPYRVLNFVIRYLPSLNERTNLSDTLPIATMTEYPSDTIPQNWLLCNGQAVSRTDYAELFAVIGTLYGAGDGSATFNVPDMKGRVAVGRDVAQTEFDVLNEAGGEKAHTLTVAEMPTHRHSEYCTANPNTGGSGIRGTFNGVEGTGLSSYLTGGSTETTGGGGVHNILQPYRVLNYIIKAKNTAPIKAVVEDSLSSTSTTNALSAKQGKTLNDKVDGIIEFGSWTPMVTADSGTLASYSVFNAFYQKIGKMAFVNIEVSIPDKGTASGNLRISLPFEASRPSILGGRENSVTGFQLQSRVDWNYVSVFNYDNSSPLISGGSYIITGTYEVEG